MKPPTPLTARRTFWAEHVQAWRSSGLTQVAYCEQHQLNTKSFGY
ncbi:IS66 family insertion sequence element accessory protein TnpA [Pseudomonas sp. O39]